MEKWYVLRTKPNSEYRVVTALQQHQIETYLPEIKSPKAYRQRKKASFFPCYLFARVDFSVMPFSKMQWLPGMCRFITFGGEKPVPIPDQVIELIQSKLDEIELTGDQPVHSFKPGDPVEIIDGPFKGIQAIFYGSTTSAERVQVLLEMLGSASRVQVPVDNLKSASPGPEAPVAKRPRRTRGRGRCIKQK